MARIKNQKNIDHLWYLGSYTLILFFIVITYHTLLSGDIIQLNPTTWKYVDKFYTFTCWLIGITMVSTVLNFLFGEIKHILFIEHSAIKKFLPLIRVLVLMGIWLIGLNLALEAINIDTSSLLTSAGI